MDTYADYSNYYGYLADGTKVQHDAWDGRQHVYYGSLVYDDGTFESASFGGGRIVGTDNGSEVHYFLTDHIGSTRVVAKVTTAGRDDLDRKDYYPFGKEWAQSDMPTSDNRYQFSGKERSNICLENDYSSILPVYDFGARSYYPEGVFFLQQDPLMEKYYSIGQYNYCAGNPVKYIDPNGEDVWEINDAGEVVNHYSDETQDAFYMVSKTDGQWQRTGQQMIFDYGTVSNYSEFTKTMGNEKGGSTTVQFTIFEINGDDNATQLFEFMANPNETTNVEWTHAKVQAEGSGCNVVGTTHKQTSTAVGSYLIHKRYPLREVNHNHPNGVPLPSKADMESVQKYQKQTPGVKSNIYVPSSGYSPYNGSGTLDPRIKQQDGIYLLPDGQRVRLINQ